MNSALGDAVTMHGVSGAVYDRLIWQIYRSGQDGSKWSDVLSSLSDSMGFLALALHSHDMRGNRNLTFLSHNYAAEYHQSYRSYYSAKNPWNRQVERAPIGAAIASPVLLASEDLVQTEFYNDWIRPQDDIGTGAGITLYRDGQRFLRLSANVRFKDGETVLRPLVRLLNGLGPHMRAAFDITQLLSQVRVGDAYRQAADLVDCAVLLLDREGRVCHCNSRAEAFRRPSAFWKSDHSQRLALADEIAQRAVDRFIAAVRDGSSPYPVEGRIRAGSERAVASFKVAMFSSPETLQPQASRFFPDLEPAVILFLSMPERRPFMSAEEVRRRFGLTGTELLLVLHLAHGHSLRDFAEARKVSDNTVRTQMKSVLHKTGASRQAALVAMMSQLLGPHEPPRFDN